MVIKSKTNTMHLEITNDVELDVQGQGTSTSKSNRKSVKVSAKSMKTPRNMAMKSSAAGTGLARSVALKQGKAVPMRSKSQKTNMNSK